MRSETARTPILLFVILGGVVASGLLVLAFIVRHPSVSFTVARRDQIPPTVSIRLEVDGVVPPPGRYPVIRPGDAVTVLVTSVDNADPSPQITLEIDGHDINGDPSWINAIRLQPGRPIVFPFEGSYAIWARARDAAGNQRTAVANVMVSEEVALKPKSEVGSRDEQ